MPRFDFIITGSGFAGSITAMILRRLGRTVALLEKGKHPRFAIGESSTPLANLLLEELAVKYELPDLASFSKWGTWQSRHPEIACGLKRGFTFYKHAWGKPIDFVDRNQQLLVAASPHDQIADTHWYRPDFDAHLAKRAVEMGAELHDQAQYTLRQSTEGWRAEGRAGQTDFLLEAPFLIDASGPRGVLYHHFNLAARPGEGFFASFPTTTGIYAHFRNVLRLDPPGEEPPYPPDDAAAHHLFNGGWIWVLRFNNGITSAGAALTQPLRDTLPSSPEAAWRELLRRLPTLQARFEGATPTTPFFIQTPIAFRAPMAAGKNWAMLPSAAGVVDPLFSTGFVLTLLGIERLAGLFSEGNPRLELLRDYEAATLRELDATGALVHSAYESFENFAAFADISRVYFAAAIWSETQRRLGRKAPGFLFSDQQEFAQWLLSLQNSRAPSKLREEIFSRIEPIDMAGLTDASRRNWHPALASDLFANAHKIPASRDEIEKMLSRCGF